MNKCDTDWKSMIKQYFYFGYTSWIYNNLVFAAFCLIVITYFS